MCQLEWVSIQPTTPFSLAFSLRSIRIFVDAFIHAEEMEDYIDSTKRCHGTELPINDTMGYFVSCYSVEESVADGVIVMLPGFWALGINISSIILSSFLRFPRDPYCTCGEDYEFICADKTNKQTNGRRFRMWQECPRRQWVRRSQEKKTHTHIRKR